MASKNSMTHLPRSRSRICLQCRFLTTSSRLDSGHNRWSKIKHDKAGADAGRSKQRAVLAKEIADASRALGADPAFKPRLVDAIAKAKKAGYPKQGIEAAIARGQGKSSTGAALENVTIEAVLPPVAMIVEVLTDNKSRVLQDVRLMMRHAGAQATPTAYLFEKRGRVTLMRKNGVSADDILEAALEAGALDVGEDEEGRITVDTEPSALKAVEASMAGQHSLEIASAETIWRPNEDTRVDAVADEVLGPLSRLQDEIHEYPGVQAIYVNADLNALQNDAAA